MAYYVKKVVKPAHQLLIFCNYGQRTYAYEEFCIKEISRQLKAPLKLIDMRWLGEISTSLLTHAEKKIPETKSEDLWNAEKARDRILKWWDPCRNAILLLVGLAHAESFYISTQERFDVYIGIRRETPVAMKDNTPEFLEEINRLGEQATHHGGYRMLAPLITYDKDKVVKLGDELGVPWQYTYRQLRRPWLQEGRGQEAAGSLRHLFKLQTKKARLLQERREGPLDIRETLRRRASGRSNALN
jgi:7-cyano-7-deazaguanine synthase